ncbi:hypothetical protein Clacol_003118 [Clathrus columnatus]|uniref:Uncharacterized protein n=1 Tax=Clathrus columnatus TaxID=1419009 RepID=A0AAV5A5Y9_9AGAM|nr:hypothetical protein Clacol_003118 [Clathrus columnatus]
MGHDGVHIQFNPDNRVFWAHHTTLHQMEEADIDEAYQRAYRFLSERVKVLVEEHKWKEIDFGSRQLLLSMTKAGFINRFTLPPTFYPFLNLSEYSEWKKQFENGIFAIETRRSPTDLKDIYIGGPRPLSDIFYMLQCIAPGMLILTCKMGEDVLGELEWSRALPPCAWVEDHDLMLRHILGSNQAYDDLLRVSRDEERAFSLSWIEEDMDDRCSTCSTAVEDDWDETASKQEWSKVPAIDGRMCGSSCVGCPRCDI